MIKEKLGDRIDGWVHTLFPFLFVRVVNPDVLTLVGTGVAGASGLAFAVGDFFVAGVLLVAGGFFDLVDGVVARHFGIATRFGAFLDSSLDRVVDILALLGVCVFFVRDDQAGWALLTAWILVATVLTSYAKARAELIIERMPGGLFERGERIGGLALGALAGWLEPVLVLLAIGGTVTVGQRFLYAWREMARLDALDAEDAFASSVQAVRHEAAPPTVEETG